MAMTVFFSWQADTPTKTGRNFIERALKSAIESISADATIEEPARDIELDHDTKGISGSPAIAEAIFQKIDSAAIYVPDLTFVGKRLDGRPTPNPNVLMEYGWALKTLGSSRIVSVMNTAHGDPTPDAMPFNLRHRRNPVIYNLSSDFSDDERRIIRDKLSRDIEYRLREVLKGGDFNARQTRELESEPYVRQSGFGNPGRFRPIGHPIGVAKNSLQSLLGGKAQEVKLSAGPVIWLRVMPNVNPHRTWKVTELEKAMNLERRVFLPLLRPGGSIGYNYLRAGDGFGSYLVNPSDPGSTYSAVFAFTSGEVWASDSYSLMAFQSNGKNLIPNRERELRQSLEDCTQFLANLGIKRPVRWEAGMDSLKDRMLVYSRQSRSNLTGDVVCGPCLSPLIVKEGLFRPDESSGEALKPFFDDLFDACGVERPPYLDE